MLVEVSLEVLEAESGVLIPLAHVISPMPQDGDGYSVLSKTAVLRMRR